MGPEWHQVYSTNLLHQSEIAKAILKEHGIECVAVDKRDTFFVTIGEIELYVKSNDVLQAKFLIEKNQL